MMDNGYIQSWATGLLLLLSATACDAYDSNLLELKSALHVEALAECGDGVVALDELCDTGIQQDEPGACPSSCDSGQPCMPQVMIGAECTRRCIYRFITDPSDDDGCCPPGSSAAEDNDCGFCGDGFVGAGESCDPADACPSEADCSSDDPCMVSEFRGDRDLCTARCEVQPIERCSDGDGCCAQGCSSDTDSDCSASCGDGVVDDSLGETCDPGSAKHPCTISCDDGDACTEDVQSGAPASCDVACAHEAIDEPRAGDGCCPPGADASLDSDCEPVCGNHVVEGDEACDGSEGCADDCRAQLEVETAAGSGDRCRQTSVPGVSDACQRCVCDSCPDTALDCYDSGDAADDEACAALVACGQRNDCYDYSCFCGAGGCLPPTGPCRAETEVAAGSTSLAVILRCYEEPQCLNYRARALGQCAMSNCQQECLR